MPPFAIGLIPLRPLFGDLRSDTPLVPTRVKLAPDCERTVMYDRDAEGKLAWVRDVVLRSHILSPSGTAEEIAHIRGDALDEIRGYVTGQSRPSVPANEDSLALCITFALSLMKALPSDVSMPRVFVDSERVLLEWSFSVCDAFFVNVFSDGRMTYVGQSGEYAWSGAVPGCANAENYPVEILAGIRWAMPQRKPGGIASAT